MSQRRIRAADAPINFDLVRADLGVPAQFPPAVLAAAKTTAERGPWLEPDRTDRTDLPFVTLDPPGSMDLDQAVLIERSTGADRPGVTVWYAIADVGAWVQPGDPIDTESQARGVTLYSPDTSTPLHPPVLSAGAASLLPGQRCPAVLWRIELDPDGVMRSCHVERAWVRSVAKLDYVGCQTDLDAGKLHPSIALLPEVGRQRQQLARQRHAITLDLPDLEVHRDGADWRLRYRAVLPIEQYNAEISLLTGMCAADMMLRGGIGILRTLPEPTKGEIKALRRATKALGIPWPPGTPPGDVISGLDGDNPVHAVFLEHAARLLRGAGYTPFDSTAPPLTEHAGVGAPYAHVTAPLRRLVDRYGSEICLALQAGRPVPTWATSKLPALPELMSAADQWAHALEKACVGAVGTFLLAGRVGQLFQGTVVMVDTEVDKATVLLDEPPVRAKCRAAGLTEGHRVTVRLDSADPATHSYRVSPVS